MRMSEPRKIEVSVEETISLSEHASVLKLQDDKIVGYAESERDGLRIDADQLSHEFVSSSLSGAPPTGEADTLHVGRTLVAALNTDGSTWGEVILGSNEVDCSAKCLVNSSHELLIQVIRADPTPEFWRKLAVEGTVRHNRTAEELAEVMLAAIRTKSLRYPSAIKKMVTLALDANRIPAMTLTVVRAPVMALTHNDCAASGFKEIWVVGPTIELTYCLYQFA